MTLACQHFVENVIVPLFRRVAHNSGLLQEVLGHVGPSDDAPVELDLHELAEPRRVVVPKCLGVSEALDNRWRLKDLLSDLGREMETNSLRLKNATFTNLYVCQFVFMGQIFMCKLWPFFQNGLRLLFTILES